jgi:hypothetical protein
MREHNYLHTSNTLGLTEEDDAARMAEDYVLSSSEKSKARATSLFVIQSIVARHGGTVNIDLATYTLDIDVPPGEQLACAQEIEEQMRSMCR